MKTIISSAKAKQVSAVRSVNGSTAPLLTRRRLLRHTTAALSLRPAPAETLRQSEVSESRCDSRPGLHTPPSTPARPELSTLPAAQGTAATEIAALAPALAKPKGGSSRPPRLLPMLGAAVVLGVACAGEAKAPVLQ